jgi:hypothetical protein
MGRVLKLQSLRIRQALTALLLFHVFALVALAASPQMHHWVHPDAGSDGHECAVTLFLHGAADGAPAVLVVIVFIAPVLTRVIFPANSPCLKHLFLSRGILEHAPPAVGTC